MKSPILTAAFFTGNRKRLQIGMKPNTLAILNSNDRLPTNADGTFPFKQNNDLYYLRGIKQEDTQLLIASGEPEKALLFIQRPNEHKKQWDGHQLRKEEASAISGIDTVYYNDEFESVLQSLLSTCDLVYLNAIEHPRANISIQTRDDRFRLWIQQQYPNHQYERLAPLMMELRLLKQPEEIAMMRYAAFVTGQGFRRVLGFVKPGVHQKQVEAEMIHEYLQYQTTWADYQPIVASGADTCILHYNSNHQWIQDGDLVLIDAAASFGGYQCDLTRTIPANGRYTARQKQLYKAVLRVHQQMKQYLKPGMLMQELQETCNNLLLEQFVGLNLCTMQDIQQHGKAYWLGKYAYHNFSHFLGLDVHDVGDFSKPLQAGMVFTNEPGIYIPEEGLGVRIENNLLLTETGVVDLTATIPIEAEEIEALMQANR